MSAVAHLVRTYHTQVPCALSAHAIASISQSKSYQDTHPTQPHHGGAQARLSAGMRKGRWGRSGVTPPTTVRSETYHVKTQSEPFLDLQGVVGLLIIRVRVGSCLVSMFACDKGEIGDGW
jgi:hypothetical protein